MAQTGVPDVTAEDQQKINSFNKRFQRLKEVEAELEGKKKLKDDCEDASNELMLVDEEQIRFSVGECFYHATAEEAEEKLQARLEEVKAEQEQLDSEVLRIKGEMEALKQVLYGKFGNSINLEE